MPPEEEKTFHDITSAAEFLPSAEFPWIFIISIITGFLVIAVVVMLITLYFVKKSGNVTLLATPVHDALQALPALREASSTQTVQESATALSSLIRDTLTQVMGSPALFQSQQEFQKTEVSFKDAKLLNMFKDHLDVLWGLEYSAPQMNSDKMSQFFDTSESLLHKLKQYHP